MSAKKVYIEKFDLDDNNYIERENSFIDEDHKISINQTLDEEVAQKLIGFQSNFK
jgi:hypothetical protein